jgi:hypothetical protein
MGTQGPVGRGSWVLRFAVTVRPLAGARPAEAFPGSALEWCALEGAWSEDG